MLVFDGGLVLVVGGLCFDFGWFLLDCIAFYLFSVGCFVSFVFLGLTFFYCCFWLFEFCVVGCFGFIRFISFVCGWWFILLGICF